MEKTTAELAQEILKREKAKAAGAVPVMFRDMIAIDDDDPSLQPHFEDRVTRAECYSQQSTSLEKFFGGSQQFETTLAKRASKLFEKTRDFRAKLHRAVLESEIELDPVILALVGPDESAARKAIRQSLKSEISERPRGNETNEEFPEGEQEMLKEYFSTKHDHHKAVAEHHANLHKEHSGHAAVAKATHDDLDDDHELKEYFKAVHLHETAKAEHHGALREQHLSHAKFYKGLIAQCDKGLTAENLLKAFGDGLRPLGGISVIAPDNPLRMIPRAGMPPAPTRPNVPSAFEKLVAIDDDESERQRALG